MHARVTLVYSPPVPNARSQAHGIRWQDEMSRQRETVTVQEQSSISMMETDKTQFHGDQQSYMHNSCWHMKQLTKNYMLLIQSKGIVSK